jgi:hypothetical protein
LRGERSPTECGDLHDPSPSPAVAVTAAGSQVGADLRVPILPQILNFGVGIEFTTYTLAVVVVNNTSEAITITGVSVPWTNCFDCFVPESRPLSIVVEPHGHEGVAVHWSVAGLDFGALAIEHSLGVSTSALGGKGIPF